MNRWTCGTGMVLTAAFAVLCAPWAGAADDGAKEELKFELPEAAFGGTPLPYSSEILEKEEFRDRPPFLAPKGTTLVSKGKPVTASAAPAMGDLKMVTDGVKNYASSALVELEAGPQWVQVDLGAEHELYAVLFWHFHAEKRVYFDIVVQASNDPEFKTGVTTLYNNDVDNSSGLGEGPDKEYIENARGRLLDPKGVKARYVRLYSNGNTNDEMNHYVEVEVWGRPVAK